MKMATTPTINSPTGPVPVPANVGGINIPTTDMLDPASYAVNVNNVMEAITQPLYSYQPYPAAGTVQPLVFFQSQPVGTITAEDTNMQLAGQLPAPQSFLIQGIGIDYLPGTAAARFGAESALGQLPDFYAIMRRGVIVLTIGSKNYLQEGPLMQLPPRAHINGVAAVADATTPAAALQTFVSVGFSDGPVFNPRPLLIPPSQNFQVSLAWPAGAIPIPSADAAARIGIQLYGTLYRPAQ
jgi:hypothetical protein